MMRSGNPAMRDQIFVMDSTSDDRMTLQGTVYKTGFLLLLVVLGATVTWNQAMTGAPPMGLVIAGGIGGFIFALITIFKKTWAPYTAPVYAGLEGLFLGGISAMFERAYPGIALQAVALTFGTLGSLLLAYTSGWIKATENFKLGVTAATGGIMMVYMASMFMGFFGVSIPFIHSSGPVGILFSLGVVVIAALNLVMDFDFIENGAERGAPKYLEWYGAFGLLVTLVWLYLEILRLLSKLRSR